MQLDELTREQLLDVVVLQAVFTEGLRKTSNTALAHANHIVSNYAKKIPPDVMTAWAKAQVDATAMLLHPAPITPPTSQ